MLRFSLLVLVFSSTIKLVYAQEPVADFNSLALTEQFKQNSFNYVASQIAKEALFRSCDSKLSDKTSSLSGFENWPSFQELSGKSSQKVINILNDQLVRVKKENDFEENWDIDEILSIIKGYYSLEKGVLHIKDSSNWTQDMMNINEFEPIISNYIFTKKEFTIDEVHKFYINTTKKESFINVISTEIHAQWNSYCTSNKRIWLADDENGANYITWKDAKGEERISKAFGAVIVKEGDIQIEDFEGHWKKRAIDPVYVYLETRIGDIKDHTEKLVFSVLIGIILLLSVAMTISFKLILKYIDKKALEIIEKSQSTHSSKNNEEREPRRHNRQPDHEEHLIAKGKENELKRINLRLDDYSVILERLEAKVFSGSSLFEDDSYTETAEDRPTYTEETRRKNTEETLFFGQPNENGVFENEHTPEFVGGKSLYILELKGTGQAKFRLYDHQQVTARAMKMIGRAITPACISENAISPNHSGIKRIEDGFAEKLPDGKWQVKTKAKIRYI